MHRVKLILITIQGTPKDDSSTEIGVMMCGVMMMRMEISIGGGEECCDVINI